MQHYGWDFQAVKVGSSEVQTLHYAHGFYKRKEANHLCRNPKLYQLLESFYSCLGPRDSWSDTYWLHSATLISTKNFQKVWHCEISLLSLLRDLKNISMDLKDSCPPGDREIEAHSSYQATVYISYKNHGYDNWDSWLTFRLGWLLRSRFMMLNSKR